MVPGVLPLQVSRVVPVAVIAALIAPVLGVVHGVGGDGGQGRARAGIWRGIELGLGVGGLVSIGGGITGTRGLELWGIGTWSRDRGGGHGGGGGDGGLGVGAGAGGDLPEQTLQ